MATVKRVGGGVVKAKARHAAKIHKSKPTSVQDKVLALGAAAYSNLAGPYALDELEAYRPDAKYNRHTFPEEFGGLVPQAMDFYNEVMFHTIGDKALTKKGGNIDEYTATVCSEHVREALVFAFLKVMIGWAERRYDHNVARIKTFLEEVGDLDGLF